MNIATAKEFRRRQLAGEDISPSLVERAIATIQAGKPNKRVDSGKVRKGHKRAVLESLIDGPLKRRDVLGDTHSARYNAVHVLHQNGYINCVFVITDKGRRALCP